MTVRETVETLTNNGTKKVYNDKTHMFVPNQNAWNEEVIRVTYHQGYGYKQVNAVMHISK